MIYWLKSKNQAGELVKRLKQADHVTAELQHRVDELNSEVQTSAAETQRLHADIGRLRAAHDDVITRLDAANRDNKQLAGKKLLIGCLHALRHQLSIVVTLITKVPY